LLALKSILSIQRVNSLCATTSPRMHLVNDRISHIKSLAKTINMITAHINGISEEIKFGTTISGLINELNITNKKIALEVNGEIIPRSQFDSRMLEDGDQIEIVTAVGGG